MTMLLQSAKALCFFSYLKNSIIFKYICSRLDLNQHGITRQHLKLLCLPIPPPELYINAYNCILNNNFVK